MIGNQQSTKSTQQYTSIVFKIQSKVLSVFWKYNNVKNYFKTYNYSVEVFWKCTKMLLFQILPNFDNIT